MRFLLNNSKIRGWPALETMSIGKIRPNLLMSSGNFFIFLVRTGPKCPKCEKPKCVHTRKFFEIKFLKIRKIWHSLVLGNTFMPGIRLKMVSRVHRASITMSIFQIVENGRKSKISIFRQILRKNSEIFLAINCPSHRD